MNQQATGAQVVPDVTRKLHHCPQNTSYEKNLPCEKTLHCHAFAQCGGCQNIHNPYPAQLQQKQKYIQKLLKKYGPIAPIIGMQDPYYYRNKVHAVVDQPKNKPLITGIYAKGSHLVIPVSHCYLENQKADAIISAIRSLLISFKLKAYNEDTRSGLVRHILIRTGYASGEIMVVLVVSSFVFPSKQNFIKALRLLHPEITTIVLNLNDKKTSMVLGDREKVIYGKGYIEDTLCQSVFRLSPKSFYQINPVQTEHLYKKAIALAQLTGKETVIDAYCGIGTIGIIASKKAKSVIGVELNGDAVQDAKLNAKRNQITNIQFYHADAGKFMVNLACESKQTIDVVFMDPPRSGSDKRFLDALLTLKPQKIIYISCGPESLARDLNYLTHNGYKALKICPVDMFPHTYHVETVVLMSKKN